MILWRSDDRYAFISMPVSLTSAMLARGSACARTALLNAESNWISASPWLEKDLFNTMFRLVIPAGSTDIVIAFFLLRRIFTVFPAN